MRQSVIKRETAETSINLSLDIDGSGTGTVDTGCGFLNHMLVLFSKHGRFDIELKCSGDTDVDYHHTTEDIAIVLGSAFRQALGDRRGITRYSDIVLPMDEALVMCACDISGRGMFVSDLDIPTEKVGDFDTELCNEFWIAFARESGITMHVRQLSGSNSHHIIEAVFKGFARVLRKAVSIDTECADEIPSTKGIL